MAAGNVAIVCGGRLVFSAKLWGVFMEKQKRDEDARVLQVFHCFLPVVGYVLCSDCSLCRCLGRLYLCCMLTAHHLGPALALVRRHAG